MNRGKVYSVSAVNQFIKNMFSREYALSVVFVKGEISNCKYHSSGHIYFTLKDRESAITCVMFAGDRRGLAFRMSDGQEVIVGGSISVYERDGKYQLYAKKIVQAGEGVLSEKYEQLKKKLEQKGYFDSVHKKGLPTYVKRVGIVTAETGAAIQDMIQIATRRNPYVQLVLYPAKVQGEGAASTIVQGIRSLDKLGVDVIIIGRGGGSMEDLWAFNEEETADAIYQCQTPIVSAVGHETDVTIADYVADLRAPTPSAAAELVVYDVRQVLESFSDYKSRLIRGVFDSVDLASQRLGYYERTLRAYNPAGQLLQKRQYVADMEERLIQMMQHRVLEKRHKLQLQAGKLDAMSPLKRLESGFAFVSDDKGNRLDSVENVTSGQTIGVTLADGKIQAQVLASYKNDEKPPINQ